MVVGYGDCLHLLSNHCHNYPTLDLIPCLLAEAVEEWVAVDRRALCPCRHLRCRPLYVVRCHKHHQWPCDRQACRNNSVVVAAVGAADARQLAELVVEDFPTILCGASVEYVGSMMTVRVAIAAGAWLAFGQPLEHLAHG